MYKSLAVVFGLVGIVAYIYNTWSSPAEVPVISDIIWKNGGNPSDERILPFSISVPKNSLEYLKERLKNTTYIPALLESNFEYGVNTEHMRKIIDYWANNYDWNEREKLLNAVPHFRTKISGLYIHFIHLKPDAVTIKTKKVLPLLLLHGWPGSVKEFYGIFPYLTKPRSGYNFVFEVIAPSLPGYGFSEAATISGLNTAQIGLIMKKLMNRLGFNKFYVQGGDWGAIIGTHMITLFPENVIGLHSNLCFIDTNPPTLAVIKLLLGSFYPAAITNSRFTHKIYPLSNFILHLITESGYLHIQATKPDTIGVSLIDSPAGLAAYILEKFSTWTNPEWRKKADGGLTLKPTPETKYTIDDLLDNVMIYWSTSSITSSMRLYSENFSQKTMSLNLGKIPTDVPTVCANYPFDLAYLPESILRNKFRNLLYVSHMPRGGHFAAFEEPELFTTDLWKGICNIENFVHKTSLPC